MKITHCFLITCLLTLPVRAVSLAKTQNYPKLLAPQKNSIDISKPDVILPSNPEENEADKKIALANDMFFKFRSADDLTARSTDLDRIEIIYLEAAEAGSVEAKIRLGDFYLYLYEKSSNEDAKESNLNNAEYYYSLATFSGSISAYIKLGDMYNEILKDENSAEINYLAAIDKGSVEAMVKLANLLLKKVSSNAQYFETAEYYEAIEYLNNAADKGSAQAQEELRGLEGFKLKKQLMNDLGQNRKEFGDLNMADKYKVLVYAVTKNSVEAMMRLAKHHLHAWLNNNSEVDLEKSEDYFEKAADKGSMQAMEYMIKINKILILDEKNQDDRRELEDNISFWKEKLSALNFRLEKNTASLSTNAAPFYPGQTTPQLPMKAKQRNASPLSANAASFYLGYTSPQPQAVKEKTTSPLYTNAAPFVPGSIALPQPAQTQQKTTSPLSANAAPFYPGQTTP